MWLLALLACSPKDSDSDLMEAERTVDPVTGCYEVDENTRVALVTDIDETLTALDGEWLDQIRDPADEPTMRPDGNTLMNAWADHGFRIFYVTARGEQLGLSDGTTGRDATTSWLTDRDFPLFSPDDVFLSEGYGELGDGAAEYKSELLLRLIDEGWTLVWAYGNADSDITAYKAAGIPNDHQYLVGELAGTLEVNPIPTEEAYTAHFATIGPTMTCVEAP